ncbi:MAG: carbonic anhydrase family protein [Spirochaetaceae bacterium]|nr:carbonic anhydrase family protein [Spirochaetaceae bacterium]
MTDGPVWSYEGDRGPACWWSLDEAFSACADGAEQSPIDLAKGVAYGDYPAVEFDYVPRAATVVNTGRTIQVNVDRGSGITVGATRCELLQFHFHHASEHTVGGARSPMELHLVHAGDAGDLAVVAVLLRHGAANETLAPIWANLPREAGSAAALPGEVRAADLLPQTRAAWRYRGSLTTPPCTEGVSWIVMTEPVTLSAAQIAAFGALYPRNFRPVQPLGRRTLGRSRGGHDA